jgi:hypothetical protein
MVTKRKVLAGAVGIHLILAVLYAPHVPIEPHLPPQLQRAIALYAAFSGVPCHFDFFAPSVSTQARAVFNVIGADGSQRQLQLITPSADANTRIAMMLTYYAYASERERLLRALGQYLLREYPDAVAVESRIEMFEIAPLQPAATAAAPKWIEVGRLLVRRGVAPGD